MNATHGAVAPHILAPTMTPPATGQVQPFTATETFLIEASRSNSLIDTADGGDFNAKWTNSANFNLRRGDRISVEMCAFNAANAGGGVPTIELTGERALAGGARQKYCDNKVMLEIFFYLNNNNTYSVGFPAKLPTGRPSGALGALQTTPINWANTPPAGLLKGVNGEQNAAGNANSWGNHKTAQTRAVANVNTMGVVGYSGWGEGFARCMAIGGGLQYLRCPVPECYTIYQFHINGAAPGVFVNALVVGDVCDGVVIASAGDPNPAPASLFATYTEGYLAGMAGVNERFNGFVGMRTYTIPDAVAAPLVFDSICNTSVTTILQQPGGPPLTNRVYMTFGTPIAVGAPHSQGNSRIFFGPIQGGDDPTNPAIPGLQLNPFFGPCDFGALCFDNMSQGDLTNLNWYRRKGGSFLSYNEFNIGSQEAPAAATDNRRFPNNTYYGTGFAGSSCDASGNMPHLWTGEEGYRNGNLLRENNNKPYILTRNDYYGMGRMMANMKGYMPYLKPQTAFILLDANELFTDLTTLANRINDILHQRLPLIGLQNQVYSDYVLGSKYSDAYQKGSSVIPYVLCQNAYYDPSLYDNANYRYNAANMSVLWDTIPPISSGGSIKIQPANFSPGYNYALSHTNKIRNNIGNPFTESGNATEIPKYLLAQKSTYCSVCKAPDNQPEAINNICYGNMCYENMPKMMLGDCWRRHPTHPMNRLSAATPFGAPAPANGIANLSMPVVLNNKMAYYEATTSAGVFAMRTQLLNEGQVIFTNMAWLGARGPLQFDWRNPAETCYNTGDPLLLYQNMAAAFRRYETYARLSQGDTLGGGPSAKRTWNEQKVDNNGWAVELDLGQTDDPANMLGYEDAGGAYQQALYPIPPGFGGATLALDTTANGWINHAQLYKTTNMIAEVPPGSTLYPTTANPNNLGIANNWYGTGDGRAAVGVGVIKRDLICPSMSNAVFGSTTTAGIFNWAADFKTLKGLGKILIRSRPTQNYFEKDANGNFKNITIFKELPQPNYGVPLPGGTPVPAADPDLNCQVIDPDRLKTPSNGLPGEFGLWTDGSLEYYQSLGLPFIPYEHTDNDGVKRLMIAVVVAQQYRALQNEPQTWELGEITWGTQLSVSHSFIDNHAIVPMNADRINFKNRLAFRYGTGSGGVGSGNCGKNPYLNLQRNNFNYVYMGAPDPTFNWNEAKNRFEFIQLNQNTLFSAFTTNANTTSQQGEPCAIINSSTRDAVFSIIDPYVVSPVQIDPAITIGANSITAPIPQGNLATIPNQGIRDSEGGIGIWNVWLCPPDYEFPPNLNPVSYWSQDRNVNINGAGFAPFWDIPLLLEQTELNHQEIVKGCVRADRSIWEGSLLYKLGFTPEQIAEPYYGLPNNRFNPNTFNNTNPNIIGTGTKPVLLGNSYNNTQNPATNINYERYMSGPPPVGTTDLNGLPKFLNGLQNNQAVAVTTQPHPLTAQDSPILTDSPFYLVYSNICETHYQSGATSQPALFYVMRNYPNQGYFYGSGSNYYQICNQDRVLSQVTTEIRNPATGELAKLSPNSVLMYKIERDIVVPPPTIDATGNSPDPEGPQAQPDPTAAAIDRLTAELGGNPPQTTGGGPDGGGGGGTGIGGGGTGIGDGTGAQAHQQQAANWVVEPDGQVIQAQPIPQQQQQLGGGALYQIPQRRQEEAPAAGEGESKTGPRARPQGFTDAPELQGRPGRRAMEYAIRTLIARANPGFGRDGYLAQRKLNELPENLSLLMTNIGRLRIPQMIGDMERGGASPGAIADTIRRELGDMRFNEQGQATNRRNEAEGNTAQLAIASSGRGRMLVRDIAQQIIDMYDRNGNLTRGGEGSYYNIKRLLEDGLENGSIIGELPDDRSFRIGTPIAPTERQRGRTRTRSRDEQDIRDATKSPGRVRPVLTRSRSQERDEIERQDAGHEHDARRRLEEVNRRYAEQVGRIQGGAQVYRHGQHVGNVRDRSGTAAAAPQTSSSAGGGETKRETAKRGKK